MLEAFRRNQALQALEARLPDDVAAVKEELKAFLEEDPANTRALFMLGRCYLHSEELDAARETLESLLAHDPDHASGKTDLATIYFRNDDHSKALELLGEVTSARPELTAPWLVLIDYLQQEGQTEAGEDARKQHAMIKAFNDKLLVAEQAFASGDFQAADGICRRLLLLVPNEVRTLRLLTRIARQFGHYEYSTATLAQCVATRPRDAGLGIEYAYSLLGSRQYQAALAQCEQLMHRAPENIDLYDLKAEILYNLGRHDEAIAIYRELAGLEDKQSLRLLHLGKVLKTVGNAGEATDRYRQAIEIDPMVGQAYWELANLKTYRFSNDEIAAMQGLLDGGELTPMNRVLIEFALGKALEDAAQFEQSFRHYESANSAYATIRPAGYLSQNDKFKSVFTAEYFASRQGQGHDSDAAIFVVGLPRSGSTLVEQILSCHTEVDATQELDEIVSIARAVNDPNQAEQGQYPQSLASLDAEAITALAQRYLDFAQPYRQDAPNFVDKAPHNFHHIGLIKTLFPKARIIDVRRDPMASGWSIYRQFFGDSFQFSYKLETIGQYYTDYIDLMNHWHSVLPGQILTIHYEDLVNDLPATVGSMLEYCGLAFEEACLNFHLNKRAVATPSAEQVRQPLYNDALEHWKNYEAFLGPLRQAIENEAPQTR